ncbi:MAG: Lipoprotein [Thermocaproicibacter melissae]|jgi:hypothetical protein|uniref:hypothetical protein n=1 Tax=Thermocaproicibacter melissae TaxID=2966552 RepID=UPI003A103A90
MKNAKLTIGIVSIVLSIVVLFQSCAAGIGSALANNTSDTSGGSGMIFTLFFLAAGIVGIVGRASKGGTIAATILYAISGIIGVTSTGIFKDLLVWGVIALIFAVVFLISIFAGQTYPTKGAASQPTSDQSDADKNA